jgi:hypothetical protein
MPFIIAVVLFAVGAWFVGGYHWVQVPYTKHIEICADNKWPPAWCETYPSPAQQFGCEHTYINPKGEDTGECR